MNLFQTNNLWLAFPPIVPDRDHFWPNGKSLGAPTTMTIPQISMAAQLTYKSDFWRIKRILVIEFEQQLKGLSLVERPFDALYVDYPPEIE